MKVKGIVTWEILRNIMFKNPMVFQKPLIEFASEIVLACVRIVSLHLFVLQASLPVWQPQPVAEIQGVLH